MMVEEVLKNFGLKERATQERSGIGIGSPRAAMGPALHSLANHAASASASGHHDCNKEQTIFRSASPASKSRTLPQYQRQQAKPTHSLLCSHHSSAKMSDKEFGGEHSDFFQYAG